MSFNVAVDGPAGAGKSTIAKAVAKEMNLIYVDTGAMYRAMALFMLRRQVPLTDSEKIIESCGQADITICYENGEQVVLLNGENVNGLLRTEEVGRAASVISPIPEVRKKLVELQKELASKSDCIMDGRDIGTCVLPDARLKIYLTATREAGDLDKIQADIEERDYRDMHREESPLRQAPDAVLVDTSDMPVEEVISAISQMCRQSRGI